jgi:hypothetical protein
MRTVPSTKSGIDRSLPNIAKGLAALGVINDTNSVPLTADSALKMAKQGSGDLVKQHLRSRFGGIGSLGPVRSTLPALHTPIHIVWHHVMR